jgi:hypothetical protein
MGLLMLAAAGTLLSHAAGALRKLGWAALVLGVLLFIPFADFFALLVSGVWVIAVSIMLSRGANAHRAAPAAGVAATS